MSELTDKLRSYDRTSGYTVVMNEAADCIEFLEQGQNHLNRVIEEKDERINHLESALKRLGDDTDFTGYNMDFTDEILAELQARIDYANEALK